MKPEKKELHKGSRKRKKESVGTPRRRRSDLMEGNASQRRGKTNQHRGNQEVDGETS